jgi:hypothetical protein
MLPQKVTPSAPITWGVKLMSRFCNNLNDPSITSSQRPVVVVVAVVSVMVVFVVVVVVVVEVE